MQSKYIRTLSVFSYKKLRQIFMAKDGMKGKGGCDIIEFVDLLFPWAWSCIRLFPSVDCLRTIHYTKSKFLPLSTSFLVAFPRKYLCLYSPYVRSVRLPGLLHN